MYKDKKCLLCSSIFSPKSARQKYCKRPIKKICSVCGDEFDTICSPDIPTTCSKSECKKKAGYIGSINSTRMCKLCGREFRPTSTTQEYCNLPVKRICQVCGSEFEIKCTGEQYKVQTCSTECQNKIASKHRQLSYKSSHTRTCKLCGKEFHPINNTQVVCENDHFRKCIVCGEEFKLNYRKDRNRADLRVTCSEECLSALMKEQCAFKRPEIQEQIKHTMKERYGVEHPSQNLELLEKQKSTMRERYGVEFFTQTGELYRERAVATNLERYGAEWATQSKEVQSKMQANSTEKYGVPFPMQNLEVQQHFVDSYREKTGYSYPMQNPEVQEKSKQTNLDRYGVENYAQTDEFKEKFKETSLERYGTEHPNQHPEIKAKIENTCLERYGAKSFAATPEGQQKISARMREIYGKDRYSQLPEWKLKIMNQCNDIDEWMRFISNPEQYIANHYENRPTCRKIAADTGVNSSTVYDAIWRNNLTHLIRSSQSYMEEELRDVLEELHINYRIHDRQTISPYEVDIIIPEFKFGIECNPTGTHNSSIPYKGIEGNITPPSYHKMKTDMCEKVGISLLHIFGYDWAHKRDVIMSMIKNRLKLSSRTIYARKCKIVKVSGQDSIKFLNENHRQGAANSPVRLGLVYNDELVSLMTFGKMRGTIGTGSEDLDDCWELVRFCSILNTSVVGGASKLFKCFIKEYSPQRVRSFSDRAHTTGNLYGTLEFKEVRRSSAGYVWVDVFNDRAYHRANAQKQNIKRFLQDENIDLNKTEREIMVEHGFVQVFDSGTITWEWKAE